MSQNRRPEERKANNMILAKQAYAFARERIPFQNSYTQPKITEVSGVAVTFQLLETTRNARKKRLPDLEKIVYYLLLSGEDTYTTYIKNTRRWTEKDPYGNCEELSDLSMLCLRKNNVPRAEKVLLTDHVFVIIDRDPTSDINDPTTWGPYCVVLDSFDDTIYENPVDMYKKMQCYYFDESNKVNPHIMRPFEPGDQLTILNELNCFIEKDYNQQQQIDKFYKKLAIILNTIKNYPIATGHMDNLIKILTQTIDETIMDVKKEEKELIQLTNFDLERKLDKKIRHILKIINADKTLIIKDNLHLKIIINLHQIYYPDSFNYFKSLLNYENIFCSLVDKNHFHNNHPVLKDGLNTIHSVLANEQLMNDLLMICMQFNKIKAAEILLQSGADPTLTINGETVVLWATKKRCVNILKLCIHHEDIFHIVDAQGFYPIHLAIKNNDSDSVQLILNKYPNFIHQQARGSGSTPLHIAAENGTAPIFKMLLKLGAAVNALDSEGLTPFHLAAKNGHIAIVNIILDNFPHLLNERNTEGWTSLHFAVANNDVELVKVLLKRGADPSIAGPEGMTPLALAKNENNSKIINAITLAIRTIEMRQSNSANTEPQHRHKKRHK